MNLAMVSGQPFMASTLDWHPRDVDTFVVLQEELAEQAEAEMERAASLAQQREQVRRMQTGW